MTDHDFVSTYLHWDEKTITDFSAENISNMYDKGYVFTRIGKGVMHQTRSVRINLADFEHSSENRRVLKKTDGIELATKVLPLSADDYKWQIAKLAKDFYDTKFGEGVMSAQKIKEILTDSSKSNFNAILLYTEKTAHIGYTISYEDNSILHYSYPFYDLSHASKDLGMGMMLRAIQYAKDKSLKYIYLGSLQRPPDVYKLQFKGLGWYDGTIHKWSQDMAQAKAILSIDSKPPK